MKNSFKGNCKNSTSSTQTLSQKYKNELKNKYKKESFIELK